MASLSGFTPLPSPARLRLLVLGIGLLILLAGCSRGEKRDYLGPPDPNPPDRTIAQVVVVPRLGTVGLGERLEFAAFARTTSGDSIGVDVNWSATGGDVSTSGGFVASVPGQYRVVARSVVRADKADSATVVVVGPENPIVRVDINPATSSVRIGQSRQFAAAAYFQDGSQASVPIFWTASGGSISSDGLYTPDTAGDQLVIAVVGAGLADTAQVRVTNIPILTSLGIEPAYDTVNQGESRKYTVTARWSDGTTTTPAVDFSTTGGVIDGSGVFTAEAAPGDYQVLAVERGGGKTATGSVRVGKDALAALAVSPASATLTPGASLRFSAVGLTTTGASVNVQVTWSATGGTIASNGTYTAGSTPGTYLVTARQSGGELVGTTAVTIVSNTATLTQLVLNPSSATVAAGETASFSVAGSWSDGGSATPTVTWSAGGGTITTRGDYTAGSVPGTYQVIARQQGGTLADTSVVTVTGPRLKALSLTPATASVVAGDTRQFSVSALWTDGSSTVPSLSWAAQGGAVSPTGVYSAGSTPGTYRVVARDGASGVADTSFVTITSPAPVLQGISVNPGSATLQAGGSQQFYAEGIWTNGGTGVPTVTWSATGGAISSSGRYTAGSTAGTFRVIARETTGGFADTADVTVQPPVPVLAGIVVQPDPVTVQPGGTQQFSVNGLWTNGGSGAPPVSWSATGGTISASGLFTAGSSAGTFRVIATESGGGLADTVVVTVASAAPVLTGVVVSPDSATVATGAGRQYAVSGVWTNGGSGAPAVTWSATGGSISSSGYFTAGGTAGTYRIVATQTGGTLADTVTVFVTSGAPVLTSLRIVPDSVNLQTGMSYEFLVQATWSNGTTTVPGVDWSATGGTINSHGRYTAGTAGGVYRVIARETGGTRADTAQIRILAPTVTQVLLSPASATVSVGGTQQFSATAKWSDGGTRPVAVTYSASGGTISTNGLYTAGQIAGTFLVIANCSCGRADTSAVIVTSPSSSVSLVSLSLTPSTVTLAPGGTQQFAVSGQWSDGTTSAPPVVYSASGGAVSSSGLYTAPSATGTYQVIARHSGGTKADTSNVAVQGGSSGGSNAVPWIEEDFSGYRSTAELLADIKGIYSLTEDVNTIHMSLDQTTGHGSSTQSLKYTWPDRSNTSNLCHDFTIGRNIQLPAAVPEVWVEVWAKFSANFTTKVPQCAGISNAGYKFVHLRVLPSSSRFNMNVGNFMTESTWGYPDNEQAYQGDPKPYQYFDGQWHRWRFHVKVGPAGKAIAYFDNTLIYAFNNVPINRTSVYSIALGRNINQGPIQVQSLNWGAVRAWRTDPGWGW